LDWEERHDFLPPTEYYMGVQIQKNVAEVQVARIEENSCWVFV